MLKLPFWVLALENSIRWKCSMYLAVWSFSAICPAPHHSHIAVRHKFQPGEGAQVCEIQDNEFSCPTADASINATCDTERCPLQGPQMTPKELQLTVTGSAKLLCVSKKTEMYYICTKHKTELELIEFEKLTLFWTHSSILYCVNIWCVSFYLFW